MTNHTHGCQIGSSAIYLRIILRIILRI